MAYEIWSDIHHVSLILFDTCHNMCHIQPMRYKIYNKWHTAADGGQCTVVQSSNESVVCIALQQDLSISSRQIFLCGNLLFIDLFLEWKQFSQMFTFYSQTCLLYQYCISSIVWAAQPPFPECTKGWYTIGWNLCMRGRNESLRGV